MTNIDGKKKLTVSLSSAAALVLMPMSRDQLCAVTLVACVYLVAQAWVDGRRVQ